MNYYVAEGTSQRGPLSLAELAQMGLRRDTMVWREGMPQWQPAASVPELLQLFGGGGAPAPQPIEYASSMYASAYAPQLTASEISSKKIAAGICGIFIGTFGVHKFVLGLTSGAVTMLVVSLVCLVLFPFTCGVSALGLPAMHIIGIIEGIIYLAKSDAEFYQVYLVQKRQWF